MMTIENECVGCPPEMGCLGSACPNRNVKRFYCDKCKDEETLYEFNGQELCINCISKQLTVVEGSDCYV
jgi:Zn finger protein HypA/HybF involved in hydrogenase expression